MLYQAGIRIASIQNKKAKLWLKGRKNWKKNLQQLISEKFIPGKAVVWMHCASLGEFEQGRPVLEKVKRQYPEANILVSFFSPSGYEIMKSYSGVNVICYLPIDGTANAKAFLQIVKPTMVLWIKYEYWYYYLSQVNRQQIPLLLVSGIFRPGQLFFKWYGGLYPKMLQFFTQLFVQNEASKKLVSTIIKAEKITLSGDTRFDRVITVAENFEPVISIEKWLQKATQVVVCGSTWDEDEKELSHYIKLHPEIKFIIAPHNVNKEEIEEIQKLLPGATLYSQLNNQAFINRGHVLIIDAIGILSRLYKYAYITYVGGGFGSDGVHNVLEAAVYGKPVVHGPEYEKFAEAKDLVENGGSFETEDALHLEKLLDQLFNDQVFYNRAAAVAKNYVYASKGASDCVLQYIQEKRLLTN